MRILQRKEKSKLKKWLRSFFNPHKVETKGEFLGAIKKAQTNHIIDNDTFDMIDGVLKISELKVRDIMIPRTQMIQIQLTDSLEECIHIILENGHSRYPVISDARDDIEGILLAKDLLIFMQHNAEPFDLKRILRPAIVVPEGKRIDHMLKEFKQERYHMAIAVDEFGGVSGLLTIEDILELIVGEIEDEHDEIEENEIRKIDEFHYTVSGLTDIETFNETFNTHFSDQDVDTLGGLVMLQFGRLPQKNDTTTLNGIVFKVIAADKRRILSLDIQLPNTYSQTASLDFNLHKGEES